MTFSLKPRSQIKNSKIQTDSKLKSGYFALLSTGVAIKSHTKDVKSIS
jgi:hypothetical protein